ncbi:MAG: sugar ABC transporter permease [Planctomycetota bacterium]
MRLVVGRRTRRELVFGLGFLGPNILGFLAFTLLPLVFALVLAFTNWDLRLHNQFKNEPLRSVGIENFVRLARDPQFWQYLGNTLFLMIAIPFGIAASLVAAILLSQDLRGGSKRNGLWIILAAILVASAGLLTMLGAGASAMTLLIGGLAGMILVAGSLGGLTVYRTLFYLPHFTAGVATFILWKKLYSPYTGPINFALDPLLGQMTAAVNSVPAIGVRGLGIAIALALVCVLGWGLRSLVRWWSEGDLGTTGLIFGSLILSIPGVLAFWWMPASWLGVGVLAAMGLGLFYAVVRPLTWGRLFRASTSGHGFGSAFLFSVALMVCQLVLLGLCIVAVHLPEMAARETGLEPPHWLTNVYWVKPALMIMGFWAAIGSNNMLLYLAGLANVPDELYEAAEIDGAGRFATFWNVTWPQLAPVTFFIVVMSVIYGLQGGFEMARTMTNGGPAGASTTLSYFVFIEGFTTGRLGYASAITWTLFGLVFMITLFNWKFGNRYVND